MVALSVLVCLPTSVLAAPPSPARKAVPARTPSTAKASFQDVFASAVRSYEDLDYEQSLEQLQKARALAKGNEQEVPVSLYLGLVHAELGNREQSLAAFRTALYLQPDAKLPVKKVSPRVERDFEEVRQSVRKDLGLTQPETATPPVATAPGVDRPVQPSPGPAPALIPPATPAAPATAYLPAVEARRESGRVPVLPLALLGVGAAAGGSGATFGLLSKLNLRLARETQYYDTRVSTLRRADNQALVADVLFGVAGAAVLGSLAAFFVSGSPSAPASTPTGGGSP